MLRAAYLTSSINVALCVFHSSRERSVLVSDRIKIPDLIGLIIQFRMSEMKKIILGRKSDYQAYRLLTCLGGF